MPQVIKDGSRLNYLEDYNITMSYNASTYAIQYLKDVSTDSIFQIADKDVFGPKVNSATTYDMDNDGNIDEMMITFSEDMKDSSVLNANAGQFTVEGYSAVSVDNTTDAAGGVAVTNADEPKRANDEFITVKTNDSTVKGTGLKTIAFTLVPWKYTDAMLNETCGETNITQIDKALPVLIDVYMADAGGTAGIFNEAGDRMDLVFSETLNAMPTLAQLESALTFAGGAADGNNLPATSGTDGFYGLATTNFTNDTIRIIYGTNGNGWSASVNAVTPGVIAVAVTSGTGISDTSSNTANTNALPKTSKSISASITDFVCSIKQSGGDYAMLSAWDNAINCNLTAGETLVFAHSGITGTVSDGASVTGAASGATGIVQHATSTQILISEITGTFQSGEQIRVNPANYVTTTDAGQQVRAVAKIEGTWTNPDTTALTIDGWVTDETHYIRIYTDTTARHEGIWDSTKYRMEVNGAQIIYVNESNVRIEGLQVMQTGSASTSHGIVIENVQSDVRISDSIIRRQTATNGTYGVGIYSFNLCYSNKFWNNIIYDWNSATVGRGISTTGLAGYEDIVYNNTIYGCREGINATTANAIYKNNIVQACTDGFAGLAPHADSNYNLSDLAADAFGANSKNSTTVRFEDINNDDFRLLRGDAAAKDSGADLSADTYLSFTTGIKGNTRKTVLWDIGADERKIEIFYSIGTNSADLNTNAYTVTVTNNNLATFTGKLAKNIGIGDKLTYSGNDAYIVRRESDTQFLIQSVIGGKATNIGAGTACTINRKFNSIFNATTAAAGVNGINTYDLVAGLYQLNLPCYADGVDSAVNTQFANYITDSNYYLRIYTPFSSTEVGTSQRHSGTWASGGFEHSAGISITDAYVRIEGLRISKTAADTSFLNGINVYPSEGSASDIRI
ncbi:MAG: hypothetical protein ACD_79C01436G0001, partial [uncultured bacterium]